MSFNFSLALRAKEDMSSGLSKVESEAIPVLLIVIINSSLDLGGDLNTIVDDVTCNVPGEGDWMLKGKSNLLKLLPVLFEIAAVFHGCLDLFDSISDVLNTRKDI